MAILKNCELFFIKCDPKRPNDKFDKQNPTWEVQIRTTSKETRKEWEALKLPVKAIVPDDGPAYFRVNIKKKSVKADGTPATPVTVVNGKLEEIDPNTIGNGSIGNVRIFQYDYRDGKGVASILMGIQLTKHLVYVPKKRDDEFGFADTEVIEPTAEEAGEDFEASDDADF